MKIIVLVLASFMMGFAYWIPVLAPSEPEWVVASNFGCIFDFNRVWCDDRPVKYIRTLPHPNDETIAGVRVPVGAPCFASTRPEQSGTRQWRLWREGGVKTGTPIGQVYCELADE